jgi:hypothetical protein
MNSQSRFQVLSLNVNGLFVDEESQPITTAFALDSEDGFIHGEVLDIES